jgi:hypothetical protein
MWTHNGISCYKIIWNIIAASQCWIMPWNFHFQVVIWACWAVCCCTAAAGGRAGLSAPVHWVPNGCPKGFACWDLHPSHKRVWGTPRFDAPHTPRRTIRCECLTLGSMVSARRADTYIANRHIGLHHEGPHAGPICQCSHLIASTSQLPIPQRSCNSILCRLS